MKPTTHFEEHVQRDIGRLREKVSTMAALAERGVRDSLKAFLENNRSLAYLVILRDQHIDELEREIDRLCLEFLVRNQPVAGVLRFVYSTIKLNRELERVGDYGESIARQALKLANLDLHFLHARYSELAQLAVASFQDAVRAFLNQNPDLARKTIESEPAVDALRNQLDADLNRLREEGRIPTEALKPLQTISRRFERLSDQAANICEETLYMCTGEYAKHRGVEVFRVLFVGEDNTCLSQMAEAIGNSLGEAKFLFSSAGLHPTQVDSQTIRFLAEKGIDASRAYAKPVAQVPNLEYYQVVVAFNKEVQKALSLPAKPVELDWSVPDPAKLKGSPEEVQAAYERAFEYINAHVRDLIRAISGSESEPPKINGE